MPHISLPDIPGIRGAMTFRPETAVPLNLLADALLRGTESLSGADRELIATYVSARNDCTYCQTMHGAVAAAHLGDAALVETVKASPEDAPISEKLKALLAIAGHVRDSGKHVTEKDVLRARAAGASDVDIHDAVLIAAAFCMFNRYVDGLATTLPADESFYASRGAILARDGYAASTAHVAKK